MKNTITLFAGLIFSLSAFCQVGEFKVYPNGLIYSEQTMGKLSHIVDSLNLKYKNCHFNTIFYSKSQTIGHIVKVNKSSIAQAMKDMERIVNVYLD